MAITRILVGQDNDDVQMLRVDNSEKFIVNLSEDWQILFGPNSEITNSKQVVKISAELDPDLLDKIRFTAYLYNPITGAIDNAATCVFDVYKVGKPGWVDDLLFSFPGTMQITNSHFYAEKPLSDFSPVNMDGGPTLMIDVTITRLGQQFKDRIYINHLGIYDSFYILKKQVAFMDLVKLEE